MMTMMYRQIQTEWPMLPSVAAVYGQRWEVTREWTRPGESGLMAGWDSSVLTCCSVTCSRQSDCSLQHCREDSTNLGVVYGESGAFI